MRPVTGTVLACATLLTVATACSPSSDRLSCTVAVGGAHTTVTLGTKTGTTTVATVAHYQIRFSILHGPKFQAEVRDAATTLMTTTAGGASGAEGTIGTPDGQLHIACKPATG